MSIYKAINLVLDVLYLFIEQRACPLHREESNIEMATSVAVGAPNCLSTLLFGTLRSGHDKCCVHLFCIPQIWKASLGASRLSTLDRLSSREYGTIAAPPLIPKVSESLREWFLWPVKNPTSVFWVDLAQTSKEQNSCYRCDGLCCCDPCIATCPLDFNQKVLFLP